VFEIQRLKRIHILGAPGSGKTSLASKLSSELGIKAYDLDSLFWDCKAPDSWTKIDSQKRNSELERITKLESWIIEGVYYSWVQPSFKRADVIIVVRTPVWIRHWRIIRRFIARHLGREPAIRKESLVDLIDLLRWNHGYNSKNLSSALDMLLQYEAPIIETSGLLKTSTGLKVTKRYDFH